MNDATSPGPDAEQERRLLSEMASGRHESLAALYQRRGAALYSLLLRMVGSADEAEELLQDAFVLFWKRAASYDATKASPWTWMVMLTRGLALDRLRSRARRQVHLTAYEQEVASLEVDHIGPTTPAGEREVSDKVTEALRRLSDPQREAIELAFYRGWSHEEISRASGQPLGTVKSHIRRGMLALRQLLKDFYA
jgi:RNA polymerase sigma-70 factor (ECF subfamily)